MTLYEIFLSQITNPFRIGLLLALFATMLRTISATGTMVPLIAGGLFVAVMLPYTQAGPLPASMLAMIGVGILANAIWLAIIFVGWRAYRRFKS